MQTATRSQAQNDASRQNGAKSKGPITHEGKSRSSANSIRHGLCSTELHFENVKEKRKFENLRQELIFTYQANTEAMKLTVERIAATMWRQAIADQVEMALFEATQNGKASLEDGGDGLPSLKTINRYRSRMAKDLKEAEALLERLQQKRAQAIQMKMKKSKEFREMEGFKALQKELGSEAMQSFIVALLNEPGGIIKPDEHENPACSFAPQA